MALKPRGSDPAEWEGTYIAFSLSDNQPHIKTFVWHVTNIQNHGILGEVRWFARWRKYAFFPAVDCVFEEVCLGEIAEFLMWATHTHKHGL